MAFIKDEEKQMLLDRYVDIEWCDDVTHLQCVRCHRVAIRHHVSNCQHLFCDKCKKVLSDRKRWKCPQCHEYVTQLDDQDFDVEVKIHQLKIFCPNKKYGCKYEDQLRRIPTHLMTCVDAGESAHPAECTGTNNMDAVVQQIAQLKATIGVLKKGLRALKKKDEEKSNEQELKTDDINKRLEVLTEKMSIVEKRVEAVDLIPKKYTDHFGSIRLLLESINNIIQQNESHIHQRMELMTFNMEEMRNKMTSIVNEQDKIKLEFDRLKADRHDTMKIMENTGEEKNDDTELAIKINNEENPSMISISESINQQFQQNELLHQQQIKNDEPLRAETYELTINDGKKILQREIGKYESEVFNFIGYEYDIKTLIERNGMDLLISIQFKKDNTINRFLNKNGFTAVKYIIRDQLNVQNKKDLIRDHYLTFTECYEHPDWTLKCGITLEILCPPYIKDDCVITMLFEPPSTDQSFVSNNGILMWTVDNYKARKEERSSNTWSPSFYTSPQGYRVRVRGILNHFGIMFVYVYFLTGEHDDLLSGDFPHKTTVTLFNRSDPFKNLVKSEQRKDVHG